MKFNNSFVKAKEFGGGDDGRAQFVDQFVRALEHSGVEDDDWVTSQDEDELILCATDSATEQN